MEARQQILPVGFTILRLHVTMLLNGGNHLVDLTECVRLMELRRPLSPAVRLPRPRSRALFSRRELKPTLSLRGAYGLCGFTTESLL